MSGFQLQADMYNSITPSEIEVRNLEERLKELENKIEELRNERPHGKWIDKGSLSCRCNQCGCKSSKEYNYCPNCGADMREVEQ